ncbi:uncharacterized protein LOC111401394 isoform X2 [Olea europaea var. sylvestris]|uniref:uncharacterized protein LOC111401394 isoform X2 n=1 Tax=Olea europaea var. sylvestris TaxID=158386 RepID=UPI000C1CFCD0|nr:uncharacterized protein LOC111401394 isoform X2 [Olea europaea var. sylvestris]
MTYGSLCRGKTIGMTRVAALLKPDNVESMEKWRAFVKECNSQPYQEMSERFKKMRANQNIMHTTSRKGFARLEVEMRAESEDPDSITRDDVYIRGHTRRNGLPINESAGVFRDDYLSGPTLPQR